MRKLFVLIIVSVGLFSCHKDRQRETFVCNCEESKRVELFISNNIQKANNMSDEEMEDVIARLHKSGVILNCRQKWFWYDYDGYLLHNLNKVDSCDVVYPYYNF